MNLGKYIIEDGLVVQCDDLMKWAEFIEFDREKYHKVDRIAGLMLSTVFLGLDHAFGGGEPVLWETMLFNEDERTTTKLFGREHTYSPEIDCWRFSFMEEAYEFHANKVTELQAKLKDSVIERE